MDLGPRSIPGLPPDPSKGVTQRVMTADDKSAHQAHQGVETVGVQRLRAFPSRRRRFGSSRKAPSALVPARLANAFEMEGGAEPAGWAAAERLCIGADRWPRGPRAVCHGDTGD